VPILIAMVNPDNLEATDDINRILRPRELGLQRLVITSEDY
jgi:type IV pilus assembly protein PilB